MGLLAPYDLQAAVDAALARGTHRVELPAGEVRLSPTPDVALELRGVRGLTLAGHGTTLVLTRVDQGLAAFHGCEDVALRDFTMRHEPAPQTQGWVRSLSPDKGAVEVEIMPGYLDDPRDLPERPVGYVFDPATRNWRVGSGDFYFQGVAALGGRRLRLTLGHGTDDPVRVGDLMAFRGKGRTDVLLDDCARSRVADVAFESAGGFVVHEAGGAGGDVFRYAVRRGPRPPGATEAPLLAANADAFHSSGVRRGPRLEGCRFEDTPDDGVPIHGYYLGVAAAGARRLVVTGQWPMAWFRAGDRVRVYGERGAVLRTPGEAPRVVAFRRLAGFVAPPSPYPPLRDKPFHYELVLDRDVPGAAAGDLACDPDAEGDGFVVRGCSILNNRARGMLLTASDGLVEDNVIDGSTIGGIVLCPELYWMQADFSHDVTIRRNRIRNVGYATVGPGSDQVGGIVVTAEIAKGRLHRGIRIEDNVLEGVHGPAIVVRHAADVTLRGNRVRDPRPVVDDAGRDHGLPRAGERFVDDAEVHG